MLTPEQLKPDLLHPDHFVRSRVAEHFGESWSPDPQLLPLVLEACRKYGLKENGSALFWARRFVPTEDSFRDLLAYIAEQKDSRETDSLVSAVESAPPELLQRFAAEVRASPNIPPESISVIDRRLELAGWSAEKLWRELQDFSRRSDAAEYDGDIDREEGHRLVEALGRHSFPDKGMIVALLSAPEIANQWLEGWLIELAGARRLTEAVPRLVEMFFDDETLEEWAMGPLARIGDVRTVELIQERFPKAEDFTRSGAADLLGHLPFPQAEEAILAFLETEKDRVVRTFLCMSLCRLFAERAVEVIPRMMKKGYDRSISDLGQELLPVLDVLGLTHPDADNWRLKREEEWRRIEQSLAEMAQELEERKPGVLTELAEPFIPPRTPPPLPLALPQILNKGAKVGRNDPCPCGSGKKYKKCCGKDN